jgi:hypothetical protein
MKNKKVFIAISSAISLAIILLVVFLNNSSQDVAKSEEKSVDKSLLVGDWIRTDASYLIKIRSINDDGILETQYFNPKPINVESANLEESYGNLHITIVLRDVNYPGSRYTLNYLQDRDILAGDYYQAVQGLNFYVEFVRNKD